MQQKDGLSRQTLKINKTDKVLNDLFSEVWAIWLGGILKRPRLAEGRMFEWKLKHMDGNRIKSRFKTSALTSTAIRWRNIQI